LKVNDEKAGSGSVGQRYGSIIKISVADPGSRFLLFKDPGSQIPDPKTVTKER
jgi:hypothetical protein